MRSVWLPAATLPAVLFVAILAAAEPAAKPKPLPAAPDLRALIACEKTIQDWMSLARSYSDPAARTSWGWRAAKLGSGMLTSYTLSQPLSVFGTRTSQIAFSGSSVVAVLRDRKLESLVREFKLEPTYEGVTTKIFGRVVRADAAARSKISLTVASSVDYPGAVLAGCSYEVDVE